MKKERVTIEKLITGGDGLAFINGKAHFIPQVLPGEVVDIVITEEKKGFNRCSVENIVEVSEQRTKPFCSIYGKCGGCNFQFTTYENQLILKKNIVNDIFMRNGKIELGEFDIVPSVNPGYRNRVQLHCNNEVKGFKKNKSNEILNITFCPVLVDGLNNLLKLGIESHKDRVTIFSDGEKNYIGGIDKNASVTILGKKISFDPLGFFQSNLSILPELILTLNKYVIGTNVMDLYCGVGLFSAFLPDTVNQITAVEIDPCVEPYINKNLNGRNFTFYPMSLEKYLKKGFYKKNLVDTIIVDPPRKGLSNDVKLFLARSKVKRILYVSCDPVTMARDVKDLKNNGYNLSFFKCFDFYPYSAHIESFGVLDLD